MKKRVIILFCLLLAAVLLPLTLHTASADDETSGQCGDNLYWSFDKETGILTITGNGEMWNYAFWFDDSIKEAVLPDGLTSIGKCAFHQCTALTNIIIPDSVISIGDSAFQECTSLKSASIGKNVTNIENSAFYKCSNLTDVNIPAKVNYIGNCAFAECSQLTNIALPSGLTSINVCLFTGCTSLTTVTIPETVTEISWMAFSDCTALSTITIPDSVTLIDIDAFENCTSLQLVFLGHSIETIGNAAFENCTALQSITIPNSVTKIGRNAFYKCTGLTEIIIPDSVTSMKSCCFSGCSGLTSAIVGKGISDIDYYMFGDCISLTTITIPDSVTKIGEDAFRNCDNLTNVYYQGTESQRFQIEILDGNESLTNATWQCGVDSHVVYGDSKRSFTFNSGEELEDLVRSRSSSDYNPRLAHFLGIMSLAAYDKNLLLANYQELGLLPFVNHYSLSNDPIAGYSIGIKQVNGSNLIMVTIRGSSNLSEWFKTNFNVSNHTLVGNPTHYWHDGFTACANAIIEDIKTCFGGTIPTNNATYVITGHSLGAATGNLLSAQLLQNGVKKTDVYDYNFACPNVVFADESDETMHSESYNCIHNICNTEDAVPCVPGELTEKIFNDDISYLMNSGYRWKKYGSTLWFMVTTATPIGAHKMELYVDFLANEYQLGAESSKPGAFAGGAIAGRCPIDMTVTDGNGNPIAGTVNNEPNYYGYEEGEKALILVNGDKKLIYVFGDNDFRVQIDGTDEGTMDYSFARVDFHGDTDSEVHDYEQVSLYNGKTFINELPSDIDATIDELYVVNDNQQPTHLVHEDGTETRVTPIDGMVEWNAEDVLYKGTTPYVIANGKPNTPRFVVKDKEGQVIDPSCYDYRYRENVAPGTGYVIITFKGEHAGSCRGWFKIYFPPTDYTMVENRDDGIYIEWHAVDGASGYVIYRRAWSSTTGGKWTDFVRWNNTTELHWTDKTVYAGTRYQYGIKAYFERRVDPVSGATIGGNVGDNYNLGIVGPLKTTVRITTRKLNSVTPGKKQLTIKWAGSSLFTGYEVQIATDAAFTKNVKTVKITNPKTYQTTIKSLKAKTTYYVRIRSYHVFEGMTYFGGWSNVLSGKTK